MVPTRAADGADDPVIGAVRAALRRVGDRANAIWCVAFSGGMDSTVLLHALVELRSQGLLQAGSDHADADDGAMRRRQLAAHHVHHGLSPNADEWAAHCARVCAEWEVAFTASRVDVDRKSASGLEAAARAARYAALDAQACDRILLAHHARDQAETVLLQLLRGGGPHGLAAMPAHADVDSRYLRPLLTVSHQEIRDYAARNQLEWIDDESNDDARFARNRLRHRVWAGLTAAFPSAERAMARAAGLQADAAFLLDELARVDLAQCRDGDALRWSALQALPRRRRANLVRYWVRCHGLTMPPERRLDDWLRQLDCGRDTQRMVLSLGPHQPSLRRYRDLLCIAPEALVWDACSWTGGPPTEIHLGASGSVRFEPSDDADAVRAPQRGEVWTLRPRQAGDRIALSPRSGHVSLKNVMQHAAVPPWLREVWPMLTCDNEVVAVAGIATAFAYRVRATPDAVTAPDGAPQVRGVQLQWKPAWL